VTDTPIRSDTDAVYEFGAFRLDSRQHQLLRDGAVVPLTPKAFDTLLILVRRQGDVVSRQELIEQVWSGAFVEEGGLTRNISVLRRALAGNETDQLYIETVPKRGYRFVGPARVVPQTAHAVTTGETSAPTPAPTPAHSPALAVGWPFAAAVLLGLILIAVMGLWNRAPDPAIRSLAVLPFESIGAAGTDEFLGPAMADALIARISRLREITLRPMRAVLEYSAATQDPRSIGRALQVDAVLDGRVHRDGDRLRVTVELIRVSDGAMVWAGQFNDRVTDLFAVQESVAQEVAEALAPRLQAPAEVSLQSRRPSRPEAYELYLRGRYQWNRRTPESLEAALALFDQAVAIDPTYASAYAGLADAYSLLAAYRPSADGESFVRASAAARRALDLDETLAEAHTSLGFVKFGREWDWDGAAREYRRAIELDPNYGTAHHWYAILLMVLGRAEESLESIRQAERLDPLSPAIGAEVATLLWLARKYDEGIEQVDRIRRLHPQARADLNAGSFYSGKGMHGRAIVETRQAQLASNDLLLLLQLAGAHASAGDRAESERLLTRYDNHVAANGLYKESFTRAGVLASMGRRDEAFQELERAYRDRFIALTWLKVAPTLDPLRSDPRFADLLRRMQLD
jgi:DNA-binding winged helix-turn-helix (wHTH) protein/TolB-like protein/tetratricopeptide (TPR) repeat protein